MKTNVHSQSSWCPLTMSTHCPHDEPHRHRALWLPFLVLSIVCFSHFLEQMCVRHKVFFVFLHCLHNVIKYMSLDVVLTLWYSFVYFIQNKILCTYIWMKPVAQWDTFSQTYGVCEWVCVTETKSGLIKTAAVIHTQLCCIDPINVSEHYWTNANI